MSRQAEEAHGKWMQEHVAYLTEHMKIGTKVYRPSRGFANIEEGTVIRIGECYFNDHSSRYTINSPEDRVRAGRHIIHKCWTADFGGGLFDDMTQTYEHDFFLDYRHAHAAQVIKITRYINNLKRDLKRFEDIAELHNAKSDGAKLEWRCV